MDESAQLGHYRVVGQLGAGGMGKVYLGTLALRLSAMIKGLSLRPIGRSRTP